MELPKTEHGEEAVLRAKQNAQQKCRVERLERAKKDDRVTLNG